MPLLWNAWCDSPAQQVASETGRNALSRNALSEPESQQSGAWTSRSSHESSAQDLCRDQPGQLCAGSCCKARLAGVAPTDYLPEWQQLSSSNQVSLEAYDVSLHGPHSH